MTDHSAGAGQWTQADIFTTTAGIEPVGALLLELGAGGYQVRDAADFEEFLEGKNGRWDYIDQDLLRLRDAETTLTAYLPENTRGAEQLAALKSGLARLKALDTDGRWGRLEAALTGVREEDWATAWKRYYKPMPVGSRLLVCPSWEACEAGPGVSVLRIDPGMAFGTGAHDSTRMCLELLQEAGPEGKTVLDLGCGSGILSIGALLLGAERAALADIDEVAVRVAEENAALNGVADRCAFHCGDLTGRVEGRYDLIFMNIVADVILSFLPDVARALNPGGALIASGIIDTREADVLAGLVRHGIAVKTKRESNGWVGLLCSPAE